MGEIRITTAKPVGYVALLSQRRAWYDGTPPATPPTPPVTPPAPNGGTGEGHEPQGDPAWLPDRLRRAEETARKKLLEELGTDKLEDAKTRLARFAELEASQLSEVEKAQKAKEKAEQERDALKAKYEAEVAQRRLDTRNSAIKAALTGAGAKNADKVFAVLLALKASDVAAVMSDDGELDSKAVGKLVDAARKDCAEDFAAGIGSPSNAGGKAPTQDKETLRRIATGGKPLVKF